MQKRINITVDETLLNRIDLFAEMNGMTRSSVLAISANQYICAMEQMPTLQYQLSELQNLIKELQPQGKKGQSKG